MLGVVALLVVGFQARDEVGGQILHGHLRVALEKVFAIDEKFLHRLAVHLHRAVVAHLGAGKLLDERLERGAFGRAEGRSVEHRGVALLFDAGSGRAHHRGAQGHVVAVELNRAHIEAVGTARGEVHVAPRRAQAHEAHAQPQGGRGVGDNAEAPEAVGHGAGQKLRGVSAQHQASGGQLEGTPVFLRDHSARDHAPRGGKRHAGAQQQGKGEIMYLLHGEESLSL